LSLGVAILLSLTAPKLALADDPWDLVAGVAGSDDSHATDNELVDGSSQVHDLEAHAGGPDQDWFLVGLQPLSSYELVVDGVAPEAVGILLDHVDSTGAVIDSATASSSWGPARTLRLRNVLETEVDTYVRVTSVCSFTCSTNANYRIQLHETTGLIPRFNNNATQVTILVVQNGSADTVTGAAHFWNGSGQFLTGQAFVLTPQGTLVINTSTIAALAGQSGSITIEHDGRFGSLAGKAVAVEPATGFTFDTAMTGKGH
jgi:hypothetical protein